MQTQSKGYTNGTGTHSHTDTANEGKEVENKMVEKLNYDGTKVEARTFTGTAEFLTSAVTAAHAHELAVISAQAKAELDEIEAKGKIEIAKIEAQAKADSTANEVSRGRTVAEMTLVFGTAERILGRIFDTIDRSGDNDVKSLAIIAEKAPKVLELRVQAEEKLGLAYAAVEEKVTIAGLELAKVRDASNERLTRGFGKFLLAAAGLPIVGKFADRLPEILIARAAARKAEAESVKAQVQVQAEAASPKAADKKPEAPKAKG